MSRTEIPVNVDEQREQVAELLRTVEYFDAQSKRRGAERDALRQQVEQLRAEAEAVPALLAEIEDVQRTAQYFASQSTQREAERDALRDELEELREATFPKSWAGFKDFIDEVYPDDIFPDDDRDLGPQFVVAARRLTEATLERDALQARLDAALAALENFRLAVMRQD